MSTLDEFLNESAERSKPTVRGSRERTMEREATKFQVDRDGNFKSGSEQSYRRVQRYMAQVKRKAVSEARRNAKSDQPSEKAPTTQSSPEPTVTESSRSKLEQPEWPDPDSSDNPLIGGDTVDLTLCDGTKVRVQGYILPP